MSTNIGDLERNKFWMPYSRKNLTSIQSSTKHLFALAETDDSRFSYVNKFGRVLNYSTTIVDIADLPTPAVYTWLTTAAKLEAISSSAADTDGGAGAGTVVVQGLDANFLEIEEEITMAGLSASSATDQSFLRVHRAFVKDCGTYSKTTAGSHTGNITIRIASGGATQIYLNSAVASAGQSLVSRYTIPANKTGYLTNIAFSSTGVKPSGFYLWRRENADVVSGDMSAKRIIETYTGITNYFSREWNVPIRLPSKTDIWMSAVGEGAGTSSSGTFDIIMSNDA